MIRTFITMLFYYLILKEVFSASNEFQKIISNFQNEIQEETEEYDWKIKSPKIQVRKYFWPKKGLILNQRMEKKHTQKIFFEDSKIQMIAKLKISQIFVLKW